MPTARTSYTGGAIALHWLIALLIIGNLIGGLVMVQLFDSADPQAKAAGYVIVGIHKAVGITVLGLTLLRIVWRLTHRPPPLPDHMTPLERWLARGTHLLFYALMLALPLTGWLMSSASVRRFPISWFGLFDVPFLPIAQDKAAAATLGDRHELLAWVAIATLALHVAGALKHHFLDRDPVLARMLPVVKPKG